MADFPALPLWTDSFIADTIHLDATETGAYLMLLMVAWRRPSNDLPDDEKQLAKFSRCGLKQWRRIAPAVMQFWTLSGGMWRQKKLDKVRRMVELQRNQKSRAGKASVLKRQGTEPTAVDKPYQQPKPKPKPKEDIPPIVPPIVPPSGDNPRKRKHRLPDDFVLTLGMTQTAERHGVSRDHVAGEFEAFRAHHGAKGSLMVDWEKAWVTWCCNHKRWFNGGSRAPPQKLGRISAAIYSLKDYDGE